QGRRPWTTTWRSSRRDPRVEVGRARGRGCGVRRLSHLLGVRRFRGVLPDGVRAAPPGADRRRAGRGCGPGRRAEDRRRPPCDLHGEGRDRRHTRRVHGHAAGHFPAGDHGRGGGTAGCRWRVPCADAAREVPVALRDPALHKLILGFLGAGALLAGLVLGGFSALLSFWAGWRDSAVFVQIGRRAFYTATAMTVLATIVLETALLSHDFSLAYVAEHTDLSTPIAL